MNAPAATALIAEDEPLLAHALKLELAQAFGQRWQLLGDFRQQALVVVGRCQVEQLVQIAHVHFVVAVVHIHAREVRQRPSHRQVAAGRYIDIACACTDALLAGKGDIASTVAVDLAIVRRGKVRSGHQVIAPGVQALRSVGRSATESIAQRAVQVQVAGHTWPKRIGTGCSCRNYVVTC